MLISFVQIFFQERKAQAAPGFLPLVRRYTPIVTYVYVYAYVFIFLYVLYVFDYASLLDNPSRSESRQAQTKKESL